MPCEEGAMRFLRRFVGVVALLLSGVGIVGCVAGIVGIWRFYQGASEKVQKVSARLDVGLRRVSDVTQNVRHSVEKARAEVAEFGKESADLGGGEEKSRRASRTLRTLVQQKVGPSMGDLGGRLATLSDAAVAASALIESVGELPPGRMGRLQPDQLERWTDQSRQLSVTLRRLEGAVGDGDKEASGREVAAATSEVDLLLQRCQATVDDWQSDLDAVREELSRVKAEVLGWLWPAAVAVTFLVGWMGVGQVSLFAHALQWCRGG
jgi:hypothetical protein